jgi:I/LWEQ domain
MMSGKLKRLCAGQDEQKLTKKSKWDDVYCELNTYRFLVYSDESRAELLSTHMLVDVSELQFSAEAAKFQTFSFGTPVGLLTYKAKNRRENMEWLDHLRRQVPLVKAQQEQEMLKRKVEAEIQNEFMLRQDKLALESITESLAMLVKMDENGDYVAPIVEVLKRLRAQVDELANGAEVGSSQRVALHIARLVDTCNSAVAVMPSGSSLRDDIWSHARKTISCIRLMIDHGQLMNTDELKEEAFMTAYSQVRKTLAEFLALLKRATVIGGPGTGNAAGKVRGRPPPNHPSASGSSSSRRARPLSGDAAAAARLSVKGGGRGGIGPRGPGRPARRPMSTYVHRPTGDFGGAGGGGGGGGFGVGGGGGFGVGGGGFGVGGGGGFGVGSAGGAGRLGNSGGAAASGGDAAELPRGMAATLEGQRWLAEVEEALEEARLSIGCVAEELEVMKTRDGARAAGLNDSDIAARVAAQRSEASDLPSGLTPLLLASPPPISVPKPTSLLPKPGSASHSAGAGGRPVGAPPLPPMPKPASLVAAQHAIASSSAAASSSSSSGGSGSGIYVVDVPDALLADARIIANAAQELMANAVLAYREILMRHTDAKEEDAQYLIFASKLVVAYIKMQVRVLKSGEGNPQIVAAARCIKGGVARLAASSKNKLALNSPAGQKLQGTAANLYAATSRMIRIAHEQEQAKSAPSAASSAINRSMAMAARLELVNTLAQSEDNLRNARLELSVLNKDPDSRSLDFDVRVSWAESQLKAHTQIANLEASHAALKLVVDAQQE